jgi:hypothetical protein
MSALLGAKPSLEEVLALRADRQATVRRDLADLTDECLAESTTPVLEPGYPAVEVTGAALPAVHPQRGVASPAVRRARPRWYSRRTRGSVKPALRAPDASPWRPAAGTRPRRCRCGSAPDPGGSPPGGVMVRLGTHLPHPAARLQTMHRSQREGRDVLSGMTPAQSTATSAIGLTPSVLPATLPVHRLARPPFNLVIPHLPGPGPLQERVPTRGHLPVVEPEARHGAHHHQHVIRRQGGVRAHRLPRTLSHLQRRLTHLDDELAALEKAAAG